MFLNKPTFNIPIILQLDDTSRGCLLEITGRGVICEVWALWACELSQVSERRESSVESVVTDTDFVLLWASTRTEGEPVNLHVAACQTPS